MSAEESSVDSTLDSTLESKWSKAKKQAKIGATTLRNGFQAGATKILPSKKHPLTGEQLEDYMSLTFLSKSEIIK